MTSASGLNLSGFIILAEVADPTVLKMKTLRSKVLYFRLLLLRPIEKWGYCDQFVCVSLCLSTSISLEPLDHLHKILCADSPWLWLGPPLAAL